MLCLHAITLIIPLTVMMASISCPRLLRVVILVVPTASIPCAVDVIAITNEPIHRHGAIRRRSHVIGHGLLPHATSTMVTTALCVSNLATHLQLVHQQAKRGDQLDQISIFRAQNVHLVLFIGLFVNLLFKMQSASLSWLHKGYEKVSTFEQDLRCCLLGCPC